MTTCPFCNRDPFHRTDSGEAVAVVCCDLGDMLFRGKRPAPDEVTIGWEDFVKIADKFSDQATEIERLGNVTDEMVKRALQGFDTGTGDPNDYPRRMRAALEAAVAAQPVI